MDQPFLFPSAILGAERLMQRSTALQSYPAISQTRDGQILIQAGPGSLTVTIDTPAYQGSHVVDPAALAQGPINLVAPRLSGIAEVGQTLTLGPGLWCHDASQPTPVLTRQWMRDGVAIPGATGTDYVLTLEDGGKTITLAETAGNGRVSARAASLPLAVARPPASLVQLQRVSVTGSVATRVFAGMDLGAARATRDILVLAAAVGTSGATITSVKVAGVTATRLAQTLSGATGVLCVGAYLARVPAGSVGDVEMLTSVRTASQHVALFSGDLLQMADSVTASIGSGSLATLSMSAGRPGGKALALAVTTGGKGFTWTGAQELYDEDIANGRFVSAALGDVDATGRIGLEASRLANIGQIAGLAIAL